MEFDEVTVEFDEVPVETETETEEAARGPTGP